MFRYTFDWQDDNGYNEIEMENRNRAGKKDAQKEFKNLTLEK